MSNGAILGVSLCRSLSAVVALGGAVWMAVSKVEGWGWLVFAAILLGCYGWSDDSKKEDGDE